VRSNTPTLARRKRRSRLARRAIHRRAVQKGEIRQCGQGFVAYDRRGRSLGIFHSRICAIGNAAEDTP
jgi:hypothetical protein